MKKILTRDDLCECVFALEELIFAFKNSLEQKHDDFQEKEVEKLSDVSNRINRIINYMIDDEVDEEEKTLIFIEDDVDEKECLYIKI